MKVLFIRPKPSPDTIGLQYLMVVEPLELEILATLIQEKHEVVICDMILEKKPFARILEEEQPDVMCITGYITHIPVMIEYCRKAHEFLPGIVTVTGGVHVEKFPEDINHPGVDYRIVRNATRAFPELISHLSDHSPFPRGVLKYNETVEPASLPPFDFFVPIPDRSLTRRYRSRYFYVFHDKVALMKTSFGCPYTCTFCFCRNITDGNFCERPIAEVMAELETIREKEIYIVDDDFLLKPARIREFINALLERNLDKKFLVYGRADFIVNNPELIRDFRQAGLRTVIVGLESFDDEELSGFRKKTTASLNERAMEILNRNSVDCYAAVIISPGWDRSAFQRAGKIMRKLRIKFVNLQPLTPLKGTGIEVNPENLIVPREDFPRWDLAHVTIRPEKMSTRDFYANILRLYEKLVLNPANLFSHAGYPLHMHWRMLKGIIKVRKQYKNRIMEAGHA